MVFAFTKWNGAVFSLLCSAALAAAAPPEHAHLPSAGGTVPLVLQVEALQVMHDLDLTKTQLHAVRDLAEKVNSKSATFHMKMPGPFHTAMVELRDQLIYNDDDQKLADAQDKVEELREDNDIGPDPIQDLDTASKATAKDALALLTTSQVAQYIGQHADDVPEPLATLTDALDAMDDATTQPWDSLRVTTALQVAVLLHGLDTPEAAETEKQVQAWLDNAHGLSKAQRADQRAALEQAAADIVKHPDPFECLRHWLERDLAELLVNHQTKASIDLMLASMPDEGMTPDAK